MGACATKPKVLKTDSGDAPAPAPPPEPAPEAAAGGGAVENLDDEKVDSNSRSLSHLFDQNEGKDSNEKASLDPSEKQETTPETEKQIQPPAEVKKASETNPPEAAHSDLVTEKTTISSDAANTDQNKVVDTEKIIEIPSEEKITAEPKKENVRENAEAFEEKIKVEVTNTNDSDPEKTESSEKATETEPATAAEGGSDQDHKEKEVKVSNEEKVGV